MRWLPTAAAMTLALATSSVSFGAPAGASAGQNQAERSVNGREITLRGCVTPGVDKGTYVLTHVEEVTQPGRSAMPPQAHGRRVIFWLDHDSDVKKQMGQMVQVRGTFSKFEESEIELKAGPSKEGGLLVEFEGSGKDVKVPNAEVGAAIGTSDRTRGEEKDLKTFLVRVNVKDVRATGACQ